MSVASATGRSCHDRPVIGRPMQSTPPRCRPRPTGWSRARRTGRRPRLRTAPRTTRSGHASPRRGSRPGVPFRNRATCQRTPFRFWSTWNSTSVPASSRPSFSFDVLALGARAGNPDAVLRERRGRGRERRPDQCRHHDPYRPLAHLVVLRGSTVRRLGGCRRAGRRDNGTLVVDHRARSMRHPVAQFALAGLVVLAVFGAASLLVLRSLANAEALRDARQFATLAGQGIVEPTIAAGLLARRATGDRGRRPDRPGARARRAGRPGEALDARRAHRVLGRAAPHRCTVPPRRSRSSSVLRTGTHQGVAERSRRPREPIRARAGRSVRGLPADPGPRRNAAPVRDLPAPERRRVDAAAASGCRSLRFSSEASSSSGSSRCPSHGASTADSAARQAEREALLVRARRGIRRRATARSRPSSTTGPSRISRGSRTR